VKIGVRIGPKKEGRGRATREHIKGLEERQEALRVEQQKLFICLASRENHQMGLVRLCSNLYLFIKCSSYSLGIMRFFS
jgi:hypothetical protein